MQYLEKRGPKIQDYVISCNSNSNLVLYYTTDYIPAPDACVMASLRSVNLNSTTSIQTQTNRLDYRSR